MFASEFDLVESSIPLLHKYFNSKLIVKEPQGLFGIPDVVVHNGDIVSIEFKLKNWKRALQQAFRYKTFSNESYVFMDQRYAKNAVAHIDSFRKYNIGLCGVTEDELIMYYEPINKQPIDVKFTNKIEEIFADLVMK